jgi:hypothetical protein
VALVLLHGRERLNARPANTVIVSHSEPPAAQTYLRTNEANICVV